MYTGLGNKVRRGDIDFSKERVERYCEYDG